MAENISVLSLSSTSAVSENSNKTRWGADQPLEQTANED
jgi:hypothetical protein